MWEKPRHFTNGSYFPNCWGGGGGGERLCQTPDLLYYTSIPILFEFILGGWRQFKKEYEISPNLLSSQNIDLDVIPKKASAQHSLGKGACYVSDTQAHK